MQSASNGVVTPFTLRGKVNGDKASPPTLSKERGVICPPIVSITVRHLHVYYHLYTDILHSITHKIIALHVLNSIQI